MNYASDELNVELYKLSGWETDDHHGPMNCPEYPLGYLLQKLPDGTQLNKTTVTYSASGIYSINGRNKSFHQYADTPEDCAAKLCIELLKQGILVKEGEL